jgi:hypothetical protein
MTSPGWSNQLMTIYEARDLTEGSRSGRTGRKVVRACVVLARHELRETLRREPAIDNTTVVALGRVYGTFFDES